MIELVGCEDIATRLGVQLRTVYQWRHRGLLPPPTVNRWSPLWSWSDIQQWAQTTGRMNP